MGIGLTRDEYEQEIAEYEAEIESLKEVCQSLDKAWKIERKERDALQKKLAKVEKWARSRQYDLVRGLYEILKTE